jgi:hypothetical protein
MELKTEVALVKTIGDDIGYGHLMSLASALWRKSLADKGYPIMGAFVPTIEDFIKDEYKDTSSTDNYDKIIANNL